MGRRELSEKSERVKALVLEGQEDVTCCLVPLALVTGEHGTISRWVGEGAGLSLVLSAVWHTRGLGGRDGRRRDGARLGVMSQGLVSPQAGLWGTPLLPNASFP